MSRNKQGFKKRPIFRAQGCSGRLTGSAALAGVFALIRAKRSPFKDRPLIILLVVMLTQPLCFAQEWDAPIECNGDKVEYFKDEEESERRRDE